MIRRITPTYVGTTALQKRKAVRSKDHPHIRGDHIIGKVVELRGKGSPPHTWGPHPHKVSMFVKEGITPTYVGTTHTGSCICHTYQDHPHIRGDHEQSLAEVQAYTGSPPHTWGPLDFLTCRML